MANFFVLFCESIEVTGQEAVWLTKLFAAASRHISDPKFKDLAERLFGDEEPSLCGIEFSASVGNKPKLRLYSDETCNMTHVAKALQAFMREWKRKEPIKLGFAQTCDKMHSGQFGGGVVVVTPERYVVWDTDVLMEMAEKEVSRVV